MRHVTPIMPLLRVFCYSYAETWHSLRIQNLTTLASVVPKIWLVPTKIWMVHVTWPRPFQGWFVIRRLALVTTNLPTEFEVSISTHYENSQKWSGLSTSVNWQYLIHTCFIVLQLRSDSCQIHGYVMLCYVMLCYDSQGRRLSRTL